MKNFKIISNIDTLFKQLKSVLSVYLDESSTAQHSFKGDKDLSFLQKLENEKKRNTQKKNQYHNPSTCISFY